LSEVLCLFDVMTRFPPSDDTPSIPDANRQRDKHNAYCDGD
jgi:hypothetical protein